MANMMLPINSSSVIPTLPTATPMQSTFLSWNLMVDLTSLILLFRSSACETGAGNFPALERPGPRRRGICLMRASEARKASYLRASSVQPLISRRIAPTTGEYILLMSFLFLFSFLRSSALMASVPWCLARSISCWSPRTQTLMRGRGIVGSLTVPEKRLSRWGS